MRINRYLAQRGYSTRRGADDLITKKLVTINGTTAKLGDRIQETDVVVVSPKALRTQQATYRYLAFNKARGVTTDVQSDSQGIVRADPALRGLFPLGRLDKDSSGLIILTNDGRLTDRLLNPLHVHEKEYLVNVDKPIPDSFIRHLERGINIEGYRTKPAVARRAGETLFRITLVEGKKHQIRRMCAAEGFQVRELKRVRVMNIAMGSLKEGAYRDITGAELEALKKSLNIF